MVKKAKNGDLVGWSFGFSDVDVENGMPTRAIKDLDLYEVSILDRQKTPAYEVNLITARSENEAVQYRSEPLFTKINVKSGTQGGVRTEKEAQVVPETILPKIDYSKYEKIINEK